MSRSSNSRAGLVSHKSEDILANPFANSTRDSPFIAPDKSKNSAYLEKPHPIEPMSSSHYSSEKKKQQPAPYVKRRSRESRKQKGVSKAAAVAVASLSINLEDTPKAHCPSPAARYKTE